MFCPLVKKRYLYTNYKKLFCFMLHNPNAHKYDFLIVGAGLYGSVFAHQAAAAGRKCLVIDRRPHTGGNLHQEIVEDIAVHTYGAHIFHTTDKRVWNFISSLAPMNRFTNAPLANYKGRLFHLPFNMNTFYAMWGTRTPAEAQTIIDQQRAEMKGRTPQNLEEQAIALVGRDLYEMLVKGYTEKQWGRPCNELPPFIIRRLPVRFTFDNRYFSDPYQGIPIDGYNTLFDRLLEQVECRLGTDFIADRDFWKTQADHIVFTGAIDEYFDYQFGQLDYRTVRLETEVLDRPDYQGNAVVNYTDRETPYTRIIEHKHFTFGCQPCTVISREYSEEWTRGKEPFYPVNDTANMERYGQYRSLADKCSDTIFGGRLAEYRYYNMDQVVARALDDAQRILTATANEKA